ncbi:peptidoglycan editing factor PgeF [Clostridium brassicae]|uniref:Purine nucleoside phosphorylase n=1 Tax=Clostridium brassicae TaxID=2999072 RepID=A0ABT4DEK8_9CLOT|nr:peptidoglycan editing factor PgeF [Clostridium brassicae]MCY6959449.1 peptidoglycan editing factor PgeF [Clostridium brassicae]
MGIVNIESYKFLQCIESGAEIFFSTAESGLDFNKSTKEGLQNIENIKKWFQVSEVGYLNQVHSDLVHIYSRQIQDGDALITSKKGVAIGVFSADCVPIIIFDKKNKVAAAVHSGWRGTIKCICINAINRMIGEFNTSVEDLSIYIGPHNQSCCYEVSEELINEFKSLSLYKNFNIAEGRNLNLQKCILIQLNSLGVKDDQVKTLDICTFCNKDYSMYSYRKNREKSGRMFSFIFLK